MLQRCTGLCAGALRQGWGAKACGARDGHLCCLIFCLQAELLLPWLHGFDHNMACQIAYSGLYRVGRAAHCWLRPLRWLRPHASLLAGAPLGLPLLAGTCISLCTFGQQCHRSRLLQMSAGARVGEWTEHLWSFLKPYSKIARFASRANWWDGFNLLLGMVTRMRLDAFPGLLKKRICRTDIKLGACLAACQLVCMYACLLARMPNCILACP